jgi:hypothetical protein
MITYAVKKTTTHDNQKAIARRQGYNDVMTGCGNNNMDKCPCQCDECKREYVDGRTEAVDRSR